MAELASDASNIDYIRDSGVQLGDKGAGGAAQPPAEHEQIVEAVEAGHPEETPAAELTEEAALDVVSAGDDSSAVDLGAPPPNVEAVEAEEAEPVEVVSDSGVNLEGLEVPPPSGSASHLTSDSAVDLGSQAEIVMPESASEAAEPAAEAARPPSMPSASDVALEALESDHPATEHPVDETLAAEEPPVSEAEVNELLNNLEETPASEPDLAAADAAEGEAAVAEAEQEVAAEEEQAAAEEEEKPAKPAKPRSNVPALVGSTLLGIVLGAGALIGARFAGTSTPALVLSLIHI